MVFPVRRIDRMLAGIFAIGVLMRLLLFVYNRVENSYDNHLETISYYAEHQQRPAPDACWQCYQPPLYYVVAAGVYQGALWVSKSTYRAWKAVQGINTALSGATLALIILLIRKCFPDQPLLVLLLAAVAAALPRDIYASAIISNDYLLVFLTTCSVWVYLLHVARPGAGSLVGLCGLAAACALTQTTRAAGPAVAGEPFATVRPKAVAFPGKACVPARRPAFPANPGAGVER